MEDFVPYELAIKLKEKGLNIKCYGHYYNGEFHIDMPPKYYQRDKYVSVPTISQVLRWLRKDHKLHISTKPYPCEDGLRWMYEVRKFSSVLVCVVVNKTGFHEPEQAFFKGISYVLDNLI